MVINASKPEVKHSNALIHKFLTQDFKKYIDKGGEMLETEQRFSLKNL